MHFYRKLPPFEMVSPTRLEEVLSLLAARREETLVYAGGTDLIPQLKRRLIRCPRLLIDLKGIPHLDTLEYNPDQGLRIGALATVWSVGHSPIVKEHFPALAQAAGSIAAGQIQRRATLAGNICHAVPSADSAPALLALQARIRCASLRGERAVPIEEFFRGPRETLLEKDEIVKAIEIPSPLPGSRGAYLKLSSRKRMDLAVVGVAVALAEDHGICQGIRIGLGAVAPTPLRARRAEAELQGARLSPERIERAAKTSAEECQPIDDHRASAFYRRTMVGVLVERAIRQLLPPVRP